MAIISCCYDIIIFTGYRMFNLYLKKLNIFIQDASYPPEKHLIALEAKKNAPDLWVWSKFLS